MKDETFERKWQLYESELEELILSIRQGEDIHLQFTSNAEATNYRARIYRFTALVKENKDKSRVTDHLFAAACNTMILQRGDRLIVKHRLDSPYAQGLRDALARAGGDPSILDPFRRLSISEPEQEAQAQEAQKAPKVPGGFGSIDKDAILREQLSESATARLEEASKGGKKG